MDILTPLQQECVDEAKKHLEMNFRYKGDISTECIKLDGYTDDYINISDDTRDEVVVSLIVDTCYHQSLGSFSGQ